MMTMAPPVVQPSLGLMALMQGVARKTRKNKISSVSFAGDGWSLGKVLSWKAVGHSKKFRLSCVDWPSFPNWMLVLTRPLKLNELAIMYERLKHLANCARLFLKLCCFCPYFYTLITLEKCKSLFSPHLLGPPMLRFTGLVNMLGREGGNRIYHSWRVCSTPPRDTL